MNSEMAYIVLAVISDLNTVLHPHLSLLISNQKPLPYK